MIIIKTYTTKNYDYDDNPAGDVMLHPASPPHAHSYGDNDIGRREKALQAKHIQLLHRRVCLVFLGTNDKS